MGDDGRGGVDRRHRDRSDVDRQPGELEVGSRLDRRSRFWRSERGRRYRVGRGVTCAGTLRRAGAVFVGAGRDTSGRDTTGVFGCWACLLGSRGTATVVAGVASGAGGSTSTVGVGSDCCGSDVVGSSSCDAAVDGLLEGLSVGCVVPGSFAGLDGGFVEDPGFGSEFDAGFDFGFDPVSGLSFCWDVDWPAEPDGPSSALATPLLPSAPAENPATTTAASASRSRGYRPDGRRELGRRELSYITTSDSS